MTLKTFGFLNDWTVQVCKRNRKGLQRLGKAHNVLNDARQRIKRFLVMV